MILTVDLRQIFLNFKRVKPVKPGVKEIKNKNDVERYTVIIGEKKKNTLSCQKSNFLTQ